MRKLLTGDRVRLIKPDDGTGQHCRNVSIEGTFEIVGYYDGNEKYGSHRIDSYKYKHTDGSTCYGCYTDENFDLKHVERDGKTVDVSDGSTVIVTSPSATVQNTVQSAITNTMNKVSNTLKRILSPALQKQYKAGFRNGELALTQRGKDELMEILAVAHEAELSAVAEEVIADEEGEDK